MPSKSTPIPIPRHTPHQNLDRLAQLPPPLTLLPPRSTLFLLTLPSNRGDTPTSLCADATPLPPGLTPSGKVRPAEVAGAAGRALGVEASMLVEWDGVGAVGAAVDVAAAAAVVAAVEECEGSFAGRGVAGEAGRIGL